MAMTPRLRTYLELERMMLILDEQGDFGAEALRDAMDPIWYSLNTDERRILDDRRIGRIVSLEGIRIPVGDTVFAAPSPPPPRRPLPEGPIEGWVSVA